MNLGACAGLSRTPENKVWYRLIQPTHINTALASAHSKARPSRFNAGHLLPAPRQFAILYFADDPIVGQFEVGAVLGAYGPGGHIPHPKLSFVTLNVSVILQDVIDLSDVTAQASLGTTVQELTGDWRGYQIRNPTTAVAAPTGIAPTQELGEAIRRTGTEGFWAVSAKVPCNRLLMVFPDNLRSGSSLTFRDGTGAVVHEIRP